MVIYNKIKVIIDKYLEKDFFHLKSRVDTQVKNWENALKWNDESNKKIAEKYTKNDIIKYYNKMYVEDIYNAFFDFWLKVYKKDLSILFNLHYENVVSLEIFTMTTEIETKWYSNKRLKDIKNFLEKDWK